MHKILIFLIFPVFPALSVSATHKRTDSMLLLLDRTILEKPVYTEIKERRIDSIQNLLHFEPDLAKRHEIYSNLFTEYRHYNMHQALLMAERKLQIAIELKNKQLEYTAEMNIAEILGIMGMYKETLDIIDNINKKDFDYENWSYYFHVYHSLYLRLFENAVTQKERDIYSLLVSQYKDSILLSIDVNSLGYMLVKSSKFVEQGKYDEALQIMTECYEIFGHDEALHGSIGYRFAEIYENMGMHEKEKQYLAMSAIADLKRAVKGYMSLRILATMLFKEGDINRAYNYIKCSMEDAVFCGARFRILEISETLPIIVAAYDKKMKEEKQRLLKYLILIAVLTTILGISALLIWLHKKKLAAAKISINKMYEDLKQMNSELDDLNKKLSESNLIKEEYIGSIFTLCSTYINKMETYRIHIHKKLLKNQAEEIRMMTSSSLLPAEQKEFFGNFDAIFLNLYPNFIEDFNALLLDNEQICAKSGDILPPELRIYALIRLGITDSGKIATFLHYSPQTVYNYKLKVKNKLAVSKEEFLEAVRKIGR